MNLTMHYTNLDYMRTMADHDEEMMQTMLGMLLEELPEEFEKLMYLYREENWDELGKVSHKMKSTLAFVGNEQMTNANKEIEQLAKNKSNSSRIGSLLTTMEQYLPAVLQELQQAYQGD